MKNFLGHLHFQKMSRISCETPPNSGSPGHWLVIINIVENSGWGGELFAWECGASLRRSRRGYMPIFLHVFSRKDNCASVYFKRSLYIILKSPSQPFLPHIWRIPNHRIEPPGLHHTGERLTPIKRVDSLHSLHWHIGCDDIRAD